MKRVIGIAILSLLSACGSSKVSSDFQPGDAEAGIRRTNAGFQTAMRAGDIDAVMSAYAADAMLLPPNMPGMSGPAAIRQFWSGYLSQGTVDLTLTTDDIQQSGDLAVETGHYVARLTPKAAGAMPVNDNGKYMVVHRKIGGQWRILRDMFSSDLAPVH